MDIKSVINNQWKRFIIEKGMLFFYAVSILLFGIIIPYFVKDIQKSFYCSVIITIMMAKPILADSVASEREKKTLESILSSPITIRKYLLSKNIFCFLFSIIFFVICNVLSVITNMCLSIPTNYSIFIFMEWYFSVVNVLLLTTIIGVYTSAKSESMHVAQNKISVRNYPFIFLLIIYFETTLQNSYEVTIAVNLIFYIIISVIFVRYMRMTLCMQHYEFYEGIFKEKNNRKHTKYEKKLFGEEIQFLSIIRHEINYMKTLKTLNLFLSLNYIGPVAMLLIGYYYTGNWDMTFPILTMSMMIPKVPTSYIAYSVGGEKTYKTGESLLSTPLNISTIFLAKAILPNIISAIMIIVSTLLLVFVRCGITNDCISDAFTPEIWILLLPISMLSSIFMTFLTAILSLALKTPRQAYFVTIYGGYLFLVPVALILFVTQNQLLWSLIYLVILLVSVVGMFLGVRLKTNRPLLISKL